MEIMRSRSPRLVKVWSTAFADYDDTPWVFATIKRKSKSRVDIEVFDPQTGKWLFDSEIGKEHVVEINTDLD